MADVPCCFRRCIFTHKVIAFFGREMSAVKKRNRVFGIIYLFCAGCILTSKLYSALSIKIHRGVKNSDGAGIVNGGEVLYNRSGGNYDADRE